MNGALLASNPNKGKQSGADKAGKGAAVKGAGGSKASGSAAKPPKDPLTVEETAQLRAAFTAFDTDGSGEIDAEEIVEALTAVKVKVTPEQAALLIADVDEDGNGKKEEIGKRKIQVAKKKKQKKNGGARIGFLSSLNLVDAHGLPCELP